MPTYRVFFAATAEIAVEVELPEGAEYDEIVETAFDEASFPYFPGGMRGDLGDWNTYSETWPDKYKMDDDYEVVED